tara:strand:+ start:170 stop:1498 length:1329 start_codon:yes stop_codon:yes gene_type:complete
MFRIRNLVEKNGIGTILKFKIDRYATSLLGGVQADVILTYSNKKEVMISGDEKDVVDATIKKLRLIKDKHKAKNLIEVFETLFKGTDVGSRAKLGKGLNKAILEKYYNPFSVGMPEKLLNNALKERDMSAKDLAAQMEKHNEQKESTTYTHTSGARAISREVAIKYSEILNCDPVDLMFNKVTIPVWGKVNLMHPVDLEKTYAPGEIYTYATNVGDTEITVVPRDIWRSDIKAIKVDAKGTMYHNQVAFYYYKKGNDDGGLNKLCIVGTKHQPNPDLEPDFFETVYYFGVYENTRGVSNLVNPDPYVKEKNKIILEDFTPTFVAPIVAMVNTDAVVDDTNKVQAIPQSEWRKEESLRIERATLIQKLNEKELSEKQYAIKIKQINNEMKSYEQKIKQKIELQEKMQEVQIARMKARAEEAAKESKLFFGKRFSQLKKEKEIA